MEFELRIINFSHNSNIFIPFRLTWKQFEYFLEKLRFYREFLSVMHANRLDLIDDGVVITECGKPHLYVKTSANDQFA